MLDELDTVHRAAANSNAAGLPALTSDMYGAVTVMYQRVRAAFQHALTGEHARHVLIEQRMRAAGLDLGNPTRRSSDGQRSGALSWTATASSWSSPRSTHGRS